MNVKDINIESKSKWFGSNTLLWDVVRSKYIFRNKSYKGNFDQPLLSVTQRDGVIKRSDLDNKVWNPSDDVSGYKLVEPNDFVISLRSFEGGLELSNIKGLVSPAYTVLEPIEDIDSNFFRWLMKSYLFIIELNKHVTGIRQGKNIGWDDFAGIYLLKPSLKEQKLISQYLDKKTSQIDSLIEKIEKKIELLKEQKTALINEYVTKGVDSNVEMKDSGNELIGEIPKHWKVKKLRYLGFFSNGISKGSEFFQSGEPFLTYSDVYKNYSLPSPSGVCTSNEKDWETYSVKYGDIFFTRTSETNDDIGISSVCLKTIDKCCFSGFLVRFRPFEQTLDPEYSKYFFRSSIPLTHFSKEMNKVTRASLSQQLLKSTLVLIPPKNEQEEILKNLTLKLENLEKINSLNQTKVERLKEYRQSLISSVVTGKIRITEDMI